MILRRRFIAGLLAAPAIIRTPGLLMPVKSVRQCVTVWNNSSSAVTFTITDVLEGRVDLREYGWHQVGRTLDIRQLAASYTLSGLELIKPSGVVSDEWI